MTEYGLKIKNKTLDYQIDGNLKNYLYDEGANGVSLALVGAGLYFTFDRPCSEPPVILIRPSNSFGFLGCNYNATTKKYEGFWAVGTGTMDYRVFKAGEVYSDESDEMGLRVYNSKKEKVFSTLHSPFNISEVKSCTIGSTYTHSQISNPFYLMYPVQIKIETLERMDTPPYLYLLRNSESVVTKQSATSFSLDWLVTVNGYYNPRAVNTTTGTSGVITVCDVGPTLSIAP
jgi:hypothetical protein